MARYEIGATNIINISEQLNMKQKGNSKQLYGFYARKRDTYEWDLIENRTGINADNVLDEFISSWRGMPKKKRQQYDLMNLQVLETPEPKKLPYPFEVPREDRIEVFGDAIIKDYDSGSVLLELRSKYQISVPKIRKHLTDNGITIRSKGSKKKKKMS